MKRNCFSHTHLAQVESKFVLAYFAPGTMRQRNSRQTTPAAGSTSETVDGWRNCFTSSTPSTAFLLLSHIMIQFASLHGGNTFRANQHLTRKLRFPNYEIIAALQKASTLLRAFQNVMRIMTARWEVTPELLINEKIFTSA